MNLSSFDYDLPRELIAQFPAKNREESRLLVFRKSNQRIDHTHFYQIEDLIRPGDRVIVNNSKVIPARIWCKKTSTGAATEFLWIEDEKPGVWKGLLRGKHKLGSRFELEEGVVASLESKCEDGTTLLKIFPEIDSIHYLLKYGKVPLPPYIQRSGFPDMQDLERYQTLYASDLGSIAAPTAGLHFSHSVINKLSKKNVKFVPVTLHVGLGTFQPLREDNVLKNQLHLEHYEVSEESAQIINHSLQEGERLIVVGTTTARALESAVEPNGLIKSGKGKTTLFIYPPYRFKVVKNLLTNFHLPKSSLLMLVAALVDREQVLQIYHEAIKQQYRFYSYGDAMLILE